MTGFLHADDAFLDLDWDYIRIYEIEIALDRESIRLSTTISNEAALTIKADQCIREQLKEVALQCSELLKELGQSADYQI